MELDRGRFIRVCGMLDSEHDGEVVAAARQATKMLRDAGITWREVLLLVDTKEPPPPKFMDKWELCKKSYPSVAAWIDQWQSSNAVAASCYITLKSGQWISAKQQALLTLEMNRARA